MEFCTEGCQQAVISLSSSRAVYSSVGGRIDNQICQMRSSAEELVGLRDIELIVAGRDCRKCQTKSCEKRSADER